MIKKERFDKFLSFFLRMFLLYKTDFCNKNGTFHVFPLNKSGVSVVYSRKHPTSAFIGCMLSVITRTTFLESSAFVAKMFHFCCTPKNAKKLELCPVSTKFSNYCSAFRLFPWPSCGSRLHRCSSGHTERCPDRCNRLDEGLP